MTYYLGPNAATHKVHLLSHAVAFVRWGQLWAYSTFHSEGMNQVKVFHGSQDMNMCATRGHHLYNTCTYSTYRVSTCMYYSVILVYQNLNYKLISCS